MILGYSRLLWTGWRLRNVSFFIAQITASTVTPNSFATCSAYSRHSSRLPDLQIIYPTSPDGNVTGPLHLIIFTGFSPITCLLIDLSFRRCSYHSDRSPLFGSCIPCLPFLIKKDENLLNIHTLSGLEWPPPFFHGTYAPAVGLLCIFADAFPRIALCRNRTGLWTAHAESALSFPHYFRFAITSAITTTVSAPRKAPAAIPLRKIPTPPMAHPPHLRHHINSSHRKLRLRPWTLSATPPPITTMQICTGYQSGPHSGISVIPTPHNTRYAAMIAMAVKIHPLIFPAILRIFRLCFLFIFSPFCARAIRFLSVLFLHYTFL